MNPIESDHALGALAILRGWKWPLDDFELHATTPASAGDEPPSSRAPQPASMRVRRKSNGIERRYATADGGAWLAAFQRDLFQGRFS